MNLTSENLKDVLLELRLETYRYSNDYEGLIKKYNMIFMGENFKRIDSPQLCYTLKTYFGYDISLSVLNEMIPDVCKILGMKIEPMAAVTDMDNPVPAAYLITL